MTTATTKTTYYLSVLDAAETTLKTWEFDTEIEREAYRLYLKNNKHLYPAGAASVETFERELVYRLIPTIEMKRVYRGRKSPALMYVWGWA